MLDIPANTFFAGFLVPGHNANTVLPITFISIYYVALRRGFRPPTSCLLTKNPQSIGIRWCEFHFFSATMRCSFSGFYRNI